MATGAIHTAAEAEIQANLTLYLQSGYYTSSEVVEMVVDLLSDDYETEAVRPVATGLVGVVKGELIAEAQTWPEVTDCDRLDRAFSTLEAKGIVARQNFSCCGSCGSAEIWDEVETEQEKGRQILGYTFFHVQDTDSAVEGYGLYLSYGSTEDDEGPALQIAREIVDALEHQGLETDWDGTWEKRIGVELDWKRRGPWLES